MRFYGLDSHIEIINDESSYQSRGWGEFWRDFAKSLVKECYNYIFRITHKEGKM
ncbi:hypothetical protein [Helicobacter didelphidarum]|uniref:hypothetical protein n=1 Tax=Helicobacter didelphidarum TaxID=2040648 RepID=UPI0015F15F92|nr:hypothetical protein [Helicobacter didelphidarum]